MMIIAATGSPQLSPMTVDIGRPCEDGVSSVETVPVGILPLQPLYLVGQSGVDVDVGRDDAVDVMISVGLLAWTIWKSALVATVVRVPFGKEVWRKKRNVWS